MIPKSRGDGTSRHNQQNGRTISRDSKPNASSRKKEDTFPPGIHTSRKKNQISIGQRWEEMKNTAVPQLSDYIDCPEANLSYEKGSHLSPSLDQTEYDNTNNIESHSSHSIDESGDSLKSSESESGSYLDDGTIEYLNSQGFDKTDTVTSDYGVGHNSETTIRDRPVSQQYSRSSTAPIEEFQDAYDEGRDAILFDALSFVERILQNMYASEICPSNVTKIRSDVQKILISSNQPEINRHHFNELLRRAVDAHQVYTTRINHQTQAYNNLKGILPSNVFNSRPGVRDFVLKECGGSSHSNPAHDEGSLQYMENPSKLLGNDEVITIKHIEKTPPIAKYFQDSTEAVGLTSIINENDSEIFDRNLTPPSDMRNARIKHPTSRAPFGK